MPIKIEMPRLSDTMEEGTLLEWKVSVGDTVEAGTHLADVETDKATMALESFEDGTVASLLLEEGDTVPIGQVILVLAEEGEDVEAAAKAGSDGGSAKSESKPEKEESDAPAEEAPKEAAADKSSDDDSASAAGPSSGEGRVRISPVARNMAEDAGLDLSGISGSGPNGRIVKKDVQKAIEGGSAAPAASKSDKPASSSAPAAPAPVPTTELKARSVKVSGMRKTIAKRLVESKTSIPHFTVTVEIEMKPLMALRKTLNEQLETQGVKLSVNDFIVRGSALALVQHPHLNSQWTGDSIEIQGSVNMGIAVALPEERGGGLVVPVIRDAHVKGLRSISLETKNLAKKAKGSGLSPDEMADGTFTISNLGMMGVEHFEAIINPPQVGILAIGAALEKPVVKDGEIVPGLIMTATLSADHRVVDGAMGAEFLQTFKTMIENPAVLLV